MEFRAASSVSAVIDLSRSGERFKAANRFAVDGPPAALTATLSLSNTRPRCPRNERASVASSTSSLFGHGHDLRAER